MKEVIQNQNNLIVNNAIGKHFLFFCFFVYAVNVLAQKEVIITGVIYDKKGKQLPYIDILIKKNDSLKTIEAYTVTDDYGRFKIIHQTKLSSILLETSSLTHTDTSKTLKLTKKQTILKSN